MNARDAYAWLLQVDEALSDATEQVNRARRAVGEVMLALSQEIAAPAASAKITEHNLHQAGLLAGHRRTYYCADKVGRLCAGNWATPAGFGAHLALVTHT